MRTNRNYFQSPHIVQDPESLQLSKGDTVRILKNPRHGHYAGQDAKVIGLAESHSCYELKTASGRKIVLQKMYLKLIERAIPNFDDVVTKKRELEARFGDKFYYEIGVRAVKKLDQKELSELIIILYKELIEQPAQ